MTGPGGGGGTGGASGLPPALTSLQNPLVKRLVRLRGRREREAEGVVLIEGAREVARAREAGWALSELYLCPPLFSPEAAEYASAWAGERGGAHLTQLSPEAFAKVSGREHPDGVLALSPTPEPRLPTPGPDALVVVLHGLEKPGNLGAIVRTADAVGATVLVLGRGADVYSPPSIRASQGSVFAVAPFALSDAEAFAWLSAHRFRTFACTPDAEQDYWDAPLRGRVALLLGTEHAGLPEEWRRGHQGLRIPMSGLADSLNVGVSAALVLYEARRQQRPLG